MNQITSIEPVTSTKGEIFKALSQNIPITGYHLPDHIYRADLIDENLNSLNPRDRVMVLDAASLPISFNHGYPAINDTTPLWEQLPGETEEAYAAYMHYLELPRTTNHENPIRLLPFIAEITSKSISDIASWCYVYFWHWRARAYDLFLAACHRKQREQRALTIEGQHFTQSEKLLEKVVNVANAKLDQEINALKEDPEAETETKLKDLITMAKDLIGIQRVAIGLPATGPSQFNLKLDGPRGTTAEETFKHIAKEAQGEESTRPRSIEMDQLLTVPEDLAQVQDLMIRLMRPDHVMPAWGNGKAIDGVAENSTSQTDSDIIDAEFENVE